MKNMRANGWTGFSQLVSAFRNNSQKTFHSPKYIFQVSPVHTNLLLSS